MEDFRWRTSGRERDADDSGPLGNPPSARLAKHWHTALAVPPPGARTRAGSRPPAGTPRRTSGGGLPADGFRRRTSGSERDADDSGPLGNPPSTRLASHLATRLAKPWHTATGGPATRYR